MTKLLFPAPEQAAVPLRDEDAAFPVNRIFCVGRNYADHAKEMGHEVDREAPFYFTKSPAHLIHSGVTVPYPPGTADFHHEMEFVVALGASGFRVAKAEAMDLVLGYAAGLDMTRRDLQGAAKDKRRPWDTGKDFENAAVIGPISRAARFRRAGAAGNFSAPEWQARAAGAAVGHGLVGVRADRPSLDALSPRTRRPDLHRHARRGRTGQTGRPASR